MTGQLTGVKSGGVTIQKASNETFYMRFKLAQIIYRNNRSLFLKKIQVLRFTDLQVQRDTERQDTVQNKKN